MWYENSNGSAVRPSDIDMTSSKLYGYIRKDIRLVEGNGEDEAPHYVWQEMRVPREVLGVCRQTLEHEGALDDVYAALSELADLIVSTME